MSMFEKLKAILPFIVFLLMWPLLVALMEPERVKLLDIDFNERYLELMQKRLEYFDSDVEENVEDNTFSMEGETS